ncbi:MAG: chitobiase/beta-hexosaminidase C-terminal domain-containing protein [Muribaculaceae bacterium]
MLLLLVCLTTFAWLHADEVTIDFSKQGYSSGKKITDVKVNDYINITFAIGTGSNDPIFHTTGNAIRFYGGNTMVVSCTGATLQEIVFTTPTSGSGSTFDEKAFTSSLGKFDSDTKTWTGENVESTQFSNGSSSSTAQVRFKSFKITYTVSGSATQVATPSFSPVEGEVEAGTKVTISCATEGAEIEYVLNGGSDYIKYTEPIEITEATTIEAYATKDGLEMSDIATAVYTIKKPVVATPTFDPAPGAVAKGTEVTITCATEGATLMYQVNGGDIQVGESPVTVVINEATTIEVIASKDGYVDSEAKAVYSIIGEAPANPTATFDFTQPSTLQPALIPPTTTSPTDEERVQLDKYVFYNNYALVKFTSPDGAKGTNWSQLWNGSDGPQVRAYKGSTITITVAESLTIEKIEFVGAVSSANLKNISYTGSLGSYSYSGTTGTWTRGGGVKAFAETIGERESVSFNVNEGIRLNQISVTTTGKPTGVEDVTVDENAPVEYYNLQGVRVENPENGIYIRRQGSKVSKVLVR